MTDFNEIKSLVETESKKQADDNTALRNEVKSLKEEVAGVQTALARPGVLRGKSDAEVKSLEVKSVFDRYARNPLDSSVKNELKAMSTIDGPNGGFSVPSVISQAIIEAPVAKSPLRDIADVQTVSTPDYTQLVEVSGAGAEWVRQGGTRNTTATPIFDTIKPSIGILAAKAPITNEAIEDAQHDLTAFLIRSLAKKFATEEAVKFISGTGQAANSSEADEPLGLLVDPRLNTVTAGAAVTVDAGVYSFANANVLLDLTVDIHTQYHNGAVYLMNRKTKAAISAMQNSNGDHIVRNSVVAGEASTLWGYPIVIDDNMPDIGAGAVPIVFGNFSEGFLIADRVGMTMMEDPYTNLGFINYVARKRVGSCIKDANALVGLRIGA